MSTRHLLQILRRVERGEMDAVSAAGEIEGLYFQDLGFARVDHRRFHRFGFPEPIFAPGKTTDEIIAITRSIVKRSGRAFITRLSPEQQEAISSEFRSLPLHRNRRARTCLVGEVPARANTDAVVVSAGTSDAPVAEEAWETLRAFGFEVPRIFDAGVAGLHRILAEKDTIETARIIIVVAGMEGALASVVGGLSGSVVIAVPTSVGYGANFGGVSALLAMLNSCTPNVLTVNIDDGFGAGFSAGLLLGQMGNGD